MHPAEVWKRSGRWEIMGEEMFRLRDRKGADLALGMTHEEIFTTLALELSSYRDLPQMWYQFQTKFRDEPRPKAGLMRTREFTMKDSYSFDLGPEGLDRSFDLHHEAYVRIFERLGIAAIPVEASSGSMGGSASTEFMCPSPVGEDTVVHCAGVRVRGQRREGDLPPGVDRGRTGARRAGALRHARRPDHRRPGRCASALRPSGRSRHSCTCSTTSSRWSCCAATTR